jgi:hypothetical protein
MTSTAARRAAMAAMLVMVAIFSTACTADQVLTVLKIIGFFV